MLYILIILLVGINAAPFLLPWVDIWQAQQLWCHLIVGLGFAWSFFENPKLVKLPNKPLSFLFSWVTIFTLFICFISLRKGIYNVRNFYPYFNFICVLLLYKYCIGYLNKKHIVQILNILRWTIMITLFMCVLQVLGLSQFFRLLDSPYNSNFAEWHNNICVGFLGNGTHLSGFLASSVPLFLWHNKREDWLALLLMFIVFFFTSTTLNDPSISGFVIFFALFVYFFKDNRLVFRSLIALVLAGILFSILFAPKLFFSPHGRLDIWRVYWQIFKQMPITGQGLGSISKIYKYTIYPEARHLHMEFFHFTFELGIIGAVAIIALIKDFLSIKVCSKTELCLKTMVIGFLLSSCFNYPAHLWLPSTWVIFAYASLLCLKNKEKITWEESVRERK